MPRRAVLAGLAVAALGFALAAPAFSGDTGDLAMTTSKHHDGPFGNDDLRFNVDNGDSANEWVKVKNRSNDKIKNIRFTEKDKLAGVTLRFYHGDENITQDTRDDGYRFDLAGDASTKFRVKIKVTESDGVGCWLTNAYKPGVGEDSALATANMNCDA